MSSTTTPCAACKLQRRKCTLECVFAPYFPPDNPQKFANIHKVFGASNVAKLLNELNASQREDAVNSLAYEAEYRLRDPVYGCVGLISVLQHKLRQVHCDLAAAKKELASYIGPSAMLPMINQQGALQQQYPNYGPTGFQMMSYNFQPMMAGPTGVPVDAHQLVVVGDQEMLRTYEQQQQQQQQQQDDLVLRYNGGFDNGGGGMVAAAGFSQISGEDGMAAPPHLALGSYENKQPLGLGNYENNTTLHHIQQGPHEFFLQQQQQQQEMGPTNHLQQLIQLKSEETQAANSQQLRVKSEEERSINPLG